MEPIELPLDLQIPGRLPGFGPGFMAHGPASSADLLAPLTRRAGVGAIVTSRDTAATRKAIRTVLGTNPAASVLADADRYSGKKRRIGAEGMTVGWIQMQLRAGCEWALTDSGYIPAADSVALQHVLAWSAKSERIIVALPLALSWLTDHRDELCSAINAAGVPVALILEHETDPLSRREAVCGLIEVLACDAPVLLLRSDVSTLGALAHGAAVVSVGTRSRYRHIYPLPEKDDDSEGFTPPTSAFVRPLLSFKYLDIIADLHTRNPDSALWKCGCVICAGRTIDWITTAVDREAAAFEHSVAALALTAAELLGDPMPSIRWQTMCAEAQLAFDEIPYPSGKPRQFPAALRAWVQSTPQSAAS
ncbi:hypothetical protein A5630_06855 [Mycolicibacterium mucogenicum]|uniref:Uncharacterized protein n=1 Tax=Mycolicibacterium mucogenicum TaxID=56689 RepID=A0A1A3GMD0_MYCMU|nr:hypothetical protein [Mycolicibacterium mucogenicum]OBJ36566.1 hypothetical protein A5630_06855 [Mycolicibacterium mucogenicum]